MVEYIIKAPPLERLGDAIAEALAEGMTQQELMSVVLTTVSTYTPPIADEAECPDSVYTELPPGLIDLPSAARKFNTPRGTLHAWVRRGHIHSYGRLPGPARGGGIVILKESEIIERSLSPKSKGGRPKKTCIQS